MRVAFVTPEYPSELPRGGGLASYVRRMAETLAAQGHRAEVFVPSRAGSACDEENGVRLHRVRAAVERRPVRAALKLLSLLRWERAARVLTVLLDAWWLAAALRRRSAQVRFDLVQSSDYQAVGLFVAPRGAPHLIRCSIDTREIMRRNGVPLGPRSGVDALARWSLRRADALYAPSRFLARWLERDGLRVHVLAPPAYLEVKPAAQRPPGLPGRYFVHFGQLSPVKGSALLADALVRACAQQPDFAMLWAGSDRFGLVEACEQKLGRHQDRFRYLGELTRPELYAVVAGAEAAVFPTAFDNLPNAVIETLLLGVPVIGTDGASVDELVVPGEHGTLVPEGDAEALAQAMLRHWRGDTPVRRGFAWQPPALRPEAAVAGLFALAGLHVD